MVAKYDLVIRGGSVVDGLGSEPFVADVAISGGRIVEVGHVGGGGKEDIRADGLLVTPGFVDIHSHYDGQVTWSNRLAPTSAHGVTTTMMGNCGVGFAPCKPEDRDRLIKLMEGIEDIPEVVMVEGLPWTWNSFSDYLNLVESRSFDMDVAAQLPHGPMRIFVMGQRGADREPATDEDIARMRELTRQAVEVGALGVSTSRTMFHKSRDGRQTPSYGAAAKELMGIAQGLADAGAGHFQLVTDFDDPREELGMLKEISKQTGRPTIFGLAQLHNAPGLWTQVLDGVTEANQDGVPLTALVVARPFGMLLGFDGSLNPFSMCPSWASLEELSGPERIEQLKRPEVRAKLIAEAASPAGSDHPQLRKLRSFDEMYPLGDPPVYTPRPDGDLAAIAARRGVSPQEAAYDALMERDATAMLFLPLANYVDRNVEAVKTMMLHENSVLGGADGGAHYALLCDASLPTYILTHWTRDRDGEKLPLPWAVKALTSETARVIGLCDRGVVAPGYKADLNLIDYDRLSLSAPRVVRDLPGGGRRLHQDTTGYVATILSGQVVAREGVPTGALPGRLVRGPQQPASVGAA